MQISKAQIIKDLRAIIGDNYVPDEHRGAKTNELGMTKSQVISLATEIADYINERNQ
jgi:hypothetical protein